MKVFCKTKRKKVGAKELASYLLGPRRLLSFSGTLYGSGTIGTTTAAALFGLGVEGFAPKYTEDH